MKPPEEKAKELYEYFKGCKESTILCVNHIIKLAENETNNDAIIYFNQVKEEIQKL